MQYSWYKPGFIHKYFNHLSKADTSFSKELKGRTLKLIEEIEEDIDPRWKSETPFSDTSFFCLKSLEYAYLLRSTENPLFRTGEKERGLSDREKELLKMLDLGNLIGRIHLYKFLKNQYVEECYSGIKTAELAILYPYPLQFNPATAESEDIKKSVVSKIKNGFLPEHALIATARATLNNKKLFLNSISTTEHGLMEQLKKQKKDIAHVLSMLLAENKRLRTETSGYGKYLHPWKLPKLREEIRSKHAELIDANKRIEEKKKTLRQGEPETELKEQKIKELAVLIQFVHKSYPINLTPMLKNTPTLEQYIKKVFPEPGFYMEEQDDWGPWGRTKKVWHSMFDAKYYTRKEEITKILKQKIGEYVPEEDQLKFIYKKTRTKGALATKQEIIGRIYMFDYLLFYLMSSYGSVNRYTAEDTQSYLSFIGRRLLKLVLAYPFPLQFIKKPKDREDIPKKAKQFRERAERARILEGLIDSAKAELEKLKNRAEELKGNKKLVARYEYAQKAQELREFEEEVKRVNRGGWVDLGKAYEKRVQGRPAFVFPKYH